MRIRYVLLLAMAVPTIAVWSFVLLTAHLRGIPSSCPSCFSHRVRPSWPQLVERFLPRFVCPYRCEACKRRFFARRGAWVRNAA